MASTYPPTMAFEVRQEVEGTNSLDELTALVQEGTGTVCVTSWSPGHRWGFGSKG